MVSNGLHQGSGLLGHVHPLTYIMSIHIIMVDHVIHNSEGRIIVDANHPVIQHVADFIMLAIQFS